MSVSIDCDCDGNPSEPDINDIGILASTDPVALEHAEEIGLGSRMYELVSIDDQ